MRRIIIGFALMLLIACNGSSDSTMAEKTKVNLLPDVVSTNPFIKSITFDISSLDDIKSVDFEVTSKTGAASKPIHASYSKSYILNRDFFNSNTSQLTIPIFGLYADYANNINLDVLFNDGSKKQFTTQLTSEAFVDTNSIYDHITKIKSRGQNDSLSFDYFYIKSGVGYPIIIDTDGEVRWSLSGITNSAATIFIDNHFTSGTTSTSATPSLTNITLDGVISTAGVVSAPFTNFHHDLLPGKVGFLAELDQNNSSPAIIESQLVEINSKGEIIKQWYMGDIFRNIISGAAEDPSNFVREGSDWFHMNSAIYDTRDNSLIISSRENFVIKIDYDSGELKWLLGDQTKQWYIDYPSLRPYALNLINGRAPIGQHALSIDNSGNLLLFNNGRESYNNPIGTSAGQTRTYSPASAYKIDESNKTADEVWSFDNNQQVFSDICSSVYQDAGGDYLINYAVAENRTKAKVLGLSPTGDVIFDYEMPTTICNTSWNARPILLTNMIFN